MYICRYVLRHFNEHGPFWHHREKKVPNSKGTQTQKFYYTKLISEFDTFKIIKLGQYPW